MNTNQYSELFLSEKEILEVLYSGFDKPTSFINFENNKLVEQFNSAVESNADSISLAQVYIGKNCTIDDFDKINRSQWFIPESYKDFDIITWLFDQCKDENEKRRVSEELELFVHYEMIDVLICLKYLVDFMREHKIVWGLGRGSSVSSFCLYLIGVHKINSLKFSLDIKEFLKGDKNDKENISLDAR